MCKPVLLHHNKLGHISWCRQCSHINIAFGTMLCAISTKQFQQFIKVVNTDLTHLENKVSHEEKSLLYATDSRYVNMVLCYTELVELAELLNHSALIFEARQILDSGY
jgi:hypothetical protein